MTQHHPLPVIFKKILHKRKVKENGTSYNLTIRMFKQKMDIFSMKIMHQCFMTLPYDGNWKTGNVQWSFRFFKASNQSKFPTLVNDNFIEKFSLLMYWHLQILKVPSAQCLKIAQNVAFSIFFQFWCFPPNFCPIDLSGNTI